MIRDAAIFIHTNPKFMNYITVISSFLNNIIIEILFFFSASEIHVRVSSSLPFHFESWSPRLCGYCTGSSRPPDLIRGSAGDRREVLLGHIPPASGTGRWKPQSTSSGGKTDILLLLRRGGSSAFISSLVVINSVFSFSRFPWTCTHISLRVLELEWCHSLKFLSSFIFGSDDDYSGPAWLFDWCAFGNGKSRKRKN